MSTAVQMPVAPGDGAERSSATAQSPQYATTEAGTIEEAAALISTRHFDCMTLDLCLGTQYGTELLEVMHEKQPAVPVILVSSADDDERWEVLRLAMLYGMRITEMAKPLDLGRLRDVFIEISDVA